MVNIVEWGIVYVYFSLVSYMQSIGVVVVYVNKGDDVFVKMLDLSNGIVISNMYGRIMFVGWKLY